MRSLLAAFLFCLTGTIANATEIFTVQKPVFCSDVKSIIEFVSGGEFQEQPFWAGKDSKSRYIIMQNSKTKTWSIIQFNDEIACVIGAGDSGNLINLGKPTKLTR